MATAARDLSVKRLSAFYTPPSVADALNIAYEQPNTRGSVRRTILPTAITAASILFAISAATAAAAIGHVSDIAFLPSAIATFAAQCPTQIFPGVVGAAVAATLYRFGRSTRMGWQWLTPGSLFSALGWVVLTLAFKAYAASFGRFDVSYGSLGTVVVLLTWLYLSSYVFLFGAELNSEPDKL